MTVVFRKAYLVPTLLLCLAPVFAQGQNTNSVNAKVNRERGLLMLSEIKEIIKSEYYDPKFRGLDLDVEFKSAESKIKTLETNSDIFTVIAQVLLDFNDSHTMFLPPSRHNRVEYGFSLQMIGEVCYIVDVKKQSDADAQGLRVGDIIVGINHFAPRRKTLWTLMYFLYALNPEPAMTLDLHGLDGRDRELIIRARIITPVEQKQELSERKSLEKEEPELKSRPYKCREVNADLIACKLYTFHG